jgi:hypothetical protein
MGDRQKDVTGKVTWGWTMSIIVFKDSALDQRLELMSSFQGGHQLENELTEWE